MAPKDCPIKFPGKCKHCPLPPWKRIEECAFYRGQIAAGVPWHWKADRLWFGPLPRSTPHPLIKETTRLKMIALRKRLERL